MVIFILVVFTLIGSIWGSVANKKRINLEEELSNTVAEMQKLSELSGKEHEQVLGKTASLQDSLTEKESQLLKARKELVSLRKSLQAIESQLSACTSSLQETNNKNQGLLQEVQASKRQVAKMEAVIQTQKDQAAASKAKPQEQVAVRDDELASAKQDNEKFQSLQDQLQSASLNYDQLQLSLEACNAQIIGFEKMLEDRSAGMDETAREMDRLRINMDVLLSKISEQKDTLQEMQEENRELVKELAAKNEEIADLQEDVIGQPVQQD